MKRPNRRVLLYSACLFVFATIAAWPSAGWSRTARHACDVDKVVRARLDNWAKQLKDSWSKNNPELIVGTYAENGVLMPTCSNGPLAGHQAIKGYFANNFLPLKPEATFDFNNAKIGGDCARPFASGLYSFKLNSSGQVLQARYTYVFRKTGPTEWLIAQHHSSLLPNPPSSCPH
jgi:hypothetical protein